MLAVKLIVCCSVYSPRRYRPEPERKRVVSQYRRRLAVRAVLLAAEPRAKVKAARAAARAWRRGALAHAFDVGDAGPAGAARSGPSCCRPTACPSAARRDRSAAGSRCSTRSPISSSARSISPSTWRGGSAPACRALRRRLARRSARTKRCISPCSTGGCARSASLTARCRRMTGCGKRRRKPRTISLARLAVVPMVLEARGLDVTPATVAAFERAGDARSAAILGRIYRDEIRHVAAGTRWFKSGCESRGFAAVAAVAGADSRALSRESLSRRSTTQPATKPVCPAISTQGVAAANICLTFSGHDFRGGHFRRQFSRGRRP